MTKEEKVKAFITTPGFFNFAKICELAGIEKTKGHRWLVNGDRKLTNAEVESIATILKQIRFK